MLIYFVLLFFLYFFANQGKKTCKNAYVVAFFVLLCIGIFRGENVGTDNGIYYDNYKVTTMNPITWSAFTEFEPGFAWFMAFVKTHIYNNFYFFRGVIFVIFMLGINYLLKRYSQNVLLGLFFLVLFLCYTGAFNIMRQYTALGLFCFVLPLLANKKNLMFYEILVVFLAFFFHRSIIVMSILPLFIYVQRINMFFTNKKYVIILLCLSYVGVFLSDKLYELIPLLSNHISFLGDRYVGYIATSIDAEEQISRLSSLLNTVFAIYIVLICPKDEKKNIFFICYILSLCFANILGSMSALFIRISSNLALFKIVLYSNMWYSVPQKGLGRYYRFFVCIYGLILFVNALIKNFGSVVPYEFLF